MEAMMTEICEFLNNYFWMSKIKSTFTISGGTITVPALKDGQYFRIIGSTFNDGVHKYPVTQSKKLKDETFKGEIWAMAVPETVVAISAEITEWQKLYGTAASSAMSPFNSESFAGYSYSKAGAGTASGGGLAPSWQDVYGGRLNKYRRLRGAT